MAGNHRRACTGVTKDLMSAFSERQRGMEFKKIKSGSIVQKIIESLIGWIKDGELQPGDQIPTEKEMAEKMGVGRNSVREATKILVHLGILEVRRAEGTFVCSGFSENMIDPLIYGIILNQSDNYESLMELREIMETGVMRLAIRYAQPSEKKELRTQLARMKIEITLGEDNMDRIFTADNEFHDIIAGMSHNPLLYKVDEVVRTLTRDLRYDTVSNMITSGRGEELYAAHEKLCSMLENKEYTDLNQAVRTTYFEYKRTGDLTSFTGGKAPETVSSDENQKK